MRRCDGALEFEENTQVDAIGLTLERLSSCSSLSESEDMLWTAGDEGRLLKRNCGQQT